jgi:hypothetical protein
MPAIGIGHLWTFTREQEDTEMMMRFAVPALVLAVAVAACGSDKKVQNASDSATPSAGQPAQPASGMQGMRGMGDSAGMGGMGGMQGGDMMTRMQQHLRLMTGASGDSLEAMLPAHRQMVASMLAQMNQQMRSMNMTVDPHWTALADSLRQDLVRMPEMSPAELKAFMPAHQARSTRLMAMHQAMMGNTTP